MKRRGFFHIATLAGSALLMAQAMALPGLADEAADVAAIRTLWTTYSTARVAADAETWLSLWDSQGIQMPPGMPARGFEALSKGVPKAFVRGAVLSMSIDPIEVTVAGDWAFTRGEYSSIRLADGKEMQIAGKFLTVLKRQDDGSWKIFRDCFNSNQ